MKTEILGKSKEDKNGDKITCIVCGGKGYISKEEFLKKIGLQNLSKILDTPLKELVNQIDIEGLAFFEKALENIEDKWESKLEEKERILRKETELEIKEIQEENNSKEQKLEEIKIEKIEVEQKCKLLKEKIEELEIKHKVTPTLIGIEGEMDFKEWADSIDRIECSEKLDSKGDYLVKIKDRDKYGNLQVVDEILIDYKKNKKITKGDIKKVLIDGKQRNKDVLYLVVENENQLRNIDKKQRIQILNNKYLFVGTKQQFYDEVPLIATILQLAKKEEGINYEELSKRIERVIIEKIPEYDQLKTHTKDIRTSADKIDTEIDEKRKEIFDEFERIKNKLEEKG